MISSVKDNETDHFLAEMVSALLGDVDGRLAVVVLDAGVGAGAEEEPHALALVLDDAVVQRRVALARLLVQLRRVLHQEVHDVQRVAIVLPRNGVVQTRFRELLYKDRHIIINIPIKIYVRGGPFRQVLFGSIPCICPPHQLHFKSARG